MVRKEREPPTFKPNEGDKIMCESGGVDYVAKVLTVGKDPKDKDKNSETKYRVHYQGWNVKWDEWVKLDRIQEWSEVREKEASKRKSTGKAPGSARKKLAIQPDPFNTNASQSQDSPNDLTEDETKELTEPEGGIKIKIPDELRTWLIDDDNNIKNKKLTIMPAKIPISTILKDFIAHKKSTSRLANENVLVELTLGIKDYFSVLLGPHLLYKFERLQYQTLLKENGETVDLTDHYGVIHLVRLFSKIGKFMVNSTLKPQQIQTIVNYMQDLLKFVSKQPNLFDLERNYSVAPPEYIKNALK